MHTSILSVPIFALMPESNELRYNFEEPTPPVSIDVRSLPQTELKELAEALKSALRVDGVAIAIAISVNTANMICIVSCGRMAPPVGALLDLNSGISGQCVRDRQTLHSRDTATDLRVDQEACDRLGLRSVVVSPILRESTCIGIIDVFSGKADAFDDAALTRIEEEAVRIASFIKVEEPPAKCPLSDSRRWNEPSTLFLVDKYGGRSKRDLAGQEAVEENDEATQDSLVLPSFLATSPAPEHSRRWIAFAAAALATTILGVVLIRHLNASGTIVPKKPADGILTKGGSAVLELPTMTSLVSDAAPQVRILMAKAIAGNSTAQSSLAEHYASGNGVQRDQVKAAVWYVIAGTRGNKEASRLAVRIMQNLEPFEIDQVHFNLGTMFRDGIGTSRDLIAAYSWFTAAQATADPRATTALLNLEQVMKPREVAEGRRRAASWLDSRRASAPASKDRGSTSP